MYIFLFDLDDTLLATTKLFSSQRQSVLPMTEKMYRKMISPQPFLRHVIQQLPGEKYIVTNASRIHAMYALKSLGLLQCFHGQIDRNTFPTDTNMKPYPNVYHFITKTILSKHHPMTRVFFFDDRLENLIIPKSMGWVTLWISTETCSQQQETSVYNIQNFHPDYKFPTILDAINALSKFIL